jgi:hypothetical protein
MKKNTLFGLLAFLLMMTLSSSAYALSLNGQYISEDGNFVLTITNSNEATGSFTGTYISKDTPVGAQTFPFVVGSFSYVNNPNGSLTPLTLTFTAVVRPENRTYVIADTWSGILTQPGRISATGVRAYLPAGGTGGLSNLGTHSFGD